MKRENSTNVLPDTLGKMFRIRNIISLIIFVGALWASVTEIKYLLDHPMVSGRIAGYMLLFAALPVTIFFGLGLLRHWTNFVKRSWKFYLFQVIATLVLPMVILGNVEDQFNESRFALVQKEIAPLIIFIDSYKEKNGKLPETLDNAPVWPETLSNITYHSGTDVYLLEIEVSSVDIDGSKIFYDSTDKHWYQFHNDGYQHYFDKEEKPESIKRYVLLNEQMKHEKSYLRKANGKWASR
jgi:hypothetical protein